MTTGRLSVEERFWPKVDVRGPDECWPWLGYTTKAGYGQIDDRRNSGDVWYAHRVSWEIHNGEPVPPGLEVLHSCDSPPCCNPGHLTVGTHHENMSAMAERDRSPRGMRSGRRKLTQEQVLAIRSAEGVHEEIGRRYGVHKNQVYRIKHRLTWRHL